MMRSLRLPVVSSLFIAATLAGCSGKPTSPPDDGDAGKAGWQVVLDEGDLDRAALSVWGSGPSDVYAVGGPLGNGLPTLVVHFDGERWKELGPGGTETFWWVGGSGKDDVWMVGEEGRIAHYDGESFIEHTSGTTATLWGVWAASKTDAWAVGGTPEGDPSEPDDVVLHWDGASWTPVTLPGPALGRALYKVWGTSSEDLYVVGENGVIWHKKGADWVLESDPPLAKGTLFTVSGCSAGEVYAVGNYDVLRSDGQTWQKLDAPLTGSVNGVACNAPGEVAIVGSGGLKQRLVDGAWRDELDVPPHLDLHAAWADGAGSFWAAGGDFLTMPAPGTPRVGVVARFGVGRVASEITP